MSAAVVSALRTGGEADPDLGPAKPHRQANLASVEALTQRLQESLRLLNCERAEFAQERSQLDSKISDSENRVRVRRQVNECLLRRVEMLEQVLHEERWRRMTALGVGNSHLGQLPATPQLPPDGLPGRSALEARLQRRRGCPSAREILQGSSVAWTVLDPG
mmetsp:Transcript_1195/g.2922  ORF Transcript_1195/g.2922 Transcript_1195/m.2922 type:complete len:162 (-) Transcript_1195:125-610(-)|eukprot:CAMPEP_0170618078 /NCGR_PEP_ID=MMETSP0224-20130122/26765_1 /TAXON_ID=285029 /ORGANISM="Togula jolla, Strain CCCM 725" /LENGTH=161 /DNA_ID=CAMNT_0010944025 /DNA_START=39 /DNA_END=524 /DNA_ORIENTATION=-